MTIYVHKYAATDGKILKMEAELSNSKKSAISSNRHWFWQREYSLTESEARAEANKRIGKKIAAAEKAIEKLLKMREAITVVDNTNP